MEACNSSFKPIKTQVIQSETVNSEIEEGRSENGNHCCSTVLMMRPDKNQEVIVARSEESEFINLVKDNVICQLA